MNNLNESYGCAQTSVIKNPLTAKPEESANDILLGIRDAISDIEDVSETIRSKIKGSDPRPCGSRSPENPCLVDWLRITKIQLVEIHGTLLDANRSL